MVMEETVLKILKSRAFFCCCCAVLLLQRAAAVSRCADLDV